MEKMFMFAIIGAIVMMSSLQAEQSEGEVTSTGEATPTEDCCDKSYGCSIYKTRCKPGRWYRTMNDQCKKTCNFCTGTCPKQCDVWFKIKTMKYNIMCSDICEKKTSFWKDDDMKKCLEEEWNQEGNAAKRWMEYCSLKCQPKEPKDTMLQNYVRDMTAAENERYYRNPFQQYRRRDYGLPNDRKDSMYNKIRQYYDYQRPLRRRNDF